MYVTYYVDLSIPRCAVHSARTIQLVHGLRQWTGMLLCLHIEIEGGMEMRRVAGCRMQNGGRKQQRPMSTRAVEVDRSHSPLSAHNSPTALPHIHTRPIRDPPCRSRCRGRLRSRHYPAWVMKTRPPLRARHHHLPRRRTDQKQRLLRRLLHPSHPYLPQHPPQSHISHGPRPNW